MTKLQTKQRIQMKVAALGALFPRCFASSQHGTSYRPLKLNIHLDLVARGYKVPSAVMSAYCNRIQYLKAIMAGGPRYDLDGNHAGEVSDEAKAIAKQKSKEFYDMCRARQKQRGTGLANAASPA